MPTTLCVPTTLFLSLPLSTSFWMKWTSCSPLPTWGPLPTWFDWWKRSKNEGSRPHASLMNSLLAKWSLLEPPSPPMVFLLPLLYPLGSSTPGSILSHMVPDLYTYKSQSSNHIPETIHIEACHFDTDHSAEDKLEKCVVCDSPHHGPVGHPHTPTTLSSGLCELCRVPEWSLWGTPSSWHQSRTLAQGIPLFRDWFLGALV